MNARYESAKEVYAKLGIDTEAALAKLQNTRISMHCWQADDVHGFEGTGALSGGIQTTGNYPGLPRTPDEVFADLDKALSLIPGSHKINVHANYAIAEPGEVIDRDTIEPRHFKRWVEFAKAHNCGLDFNPTFFSHPKAAGLTLTSPDEDIRNFWIRHGIACIRISEYFARETGFPCLMNIWIGDGFKDVPADRMGPRMRLKASLDEIFAEKYDHVIDSVESKVFGIGLESCTVGSNEFYMSYAGTHPGVYNLLDNGHYHPTEVVSDKIPALLCFFDKIPLHVTRPVRWDSDHVVAFDDELKEIMKEIVRNDALDRVLIGLDFFDASINRVAAWVIGTRNAEKALLWALLQPNARLKELQDTAQFTEKFMLMEEAKTLPFSDIWAEYCRRAGVPADASWFKEIQQYEKDVQLKR